MPTKKVSWSKRARKQFIEIANYIMVDSVQNSEKFQERLRKKLIRVAEYPEASPRDKYKLFNDGSFRAFTIFEYRISYKIKNEELRILRIRHSGMKPKYY